jgi:hypothetical protein
MIDALDVDLQDPELLAEIFLLADLMVAASESTRPLSQASIDKILWNPAAVARCTARC